MSHEVIDVAAQFGKIMEATNLSADTIRAMSSPVLAGEVSGDQVPFGGDFLVQGDAPIAQPGSGESPMRFTMSNTTCTGGIDDKID